MSTEAPSKMTPAEVVEAVDGWLTEHEGADKREAFAAVAERNGRTANSLAQTYYTAKRKERGAGTRKRRQVSAAPSLSPKATAAMRSLTEHIAALEAEVAQLRAFKSAVVGAIGRG